MKKTYGVCIIVSNDNHPEESERSRSLLPFTDPLYATQAASHDLPRTYNTPERMQKPRSPDYLCIKQFGSTLSRRDDAAAHGCCTGIASALNTACADVLRKQTNDKHTRSATEGGRESRANMVEMVPNVSSQRERGTFHALTQVGADALRLTSSGWPGSPWGIGCPTGPS